MRPGRTAPQNQPDEERTVTYDFARLMKSEQAGGCPGVVVFDIRGDIAEIDAEPDLSGLV